MKKLLTYIAIASLIGIFCLASIARKPVYRGKASNQSTNNGPMMEVFFANGTKKVYRYKEDGTLLSVSEQ